MLKILRKNTKHIFIAILILIIPAFCFFGINLLLGSNGRGGLAGKINGKPISWERFVLYQQETRVQLSAQMMLLFGVQSTDQLSAFRNRFNELFTYQNLNQLTWERQILADLAKRNKIPSNQEEVALWVSRFPLFQVNGQFNPERYQLILRNIFGTSPSTFEKTLLTTLKIQRLQQLITQNVPLSVQEKEEAYTQLHQKVQIQYLLIPNESFQKKITSSDEELKQFYLDHQEMFRKPETVQVQYFEMTASDVSPNKDISAQELESHYEINKDYFINPDTGKPKLLHQVKDEIKEVILSQRREEMLYEKITDLAVALINDPSAEKAEKEFGLKLKKTDSFAQENSPFDANLTEMAFSLPIGEFSRPLQSEKAIYLICPIQRNPSTIPEFKECEKEVKEKFMHAQAAQLAQKEAEKKREEIAAAMFTSSFEEAAKKLKLSVTTPSPFSQQDPFKYSEIKQTAFELTQNEISPVITTKEGSLFYVVQEKIKPEYKEEATFITQLENVKKKQHYQAWLSNIKQEANLIDLTPFF